MSDIEVPRGTLVADIKVRSMRLRQQLRIEVRDSALNLVGQLHVDEPLSVPPGHYEVMAVLQDGRPYTQIVKVESDTLARVEFEIKPTTLVDGPITTRYNEYGYVRSLSGAGGIRLHGRISFQAFSGTRIAGTEYMIDVTDMLDAGGSSLQLEIFPWLDEPLDETSAVPVIGVIIDGTVRFISLQLNPVARGDESAVMLEVVHSDTRIETRTWVHPERKVTSAIEHMLFERRVFQAYSIADASAEDLLQAKYSDPVGATLGAIVMHRAGTLGKRLSWLENLVRDFDWLPDGKVLLAKELYKQDGDPSRVFELLQRAATQRPLYTASFASLLETLRRWSPDSEYSAEARRLATALGNFAVDVDWSALTLTTTEVHEWMS